MKYKPFSNDFLTQVENFILKKKESNTQPLIAAFDADGTLWDTDLGEHFFSYIIKHSLVPLPKKPMDFYLDKKMTNPVEAYYWLAQILKNKPLALIKAWAQEAFNTLKPFPFFEAQTQLIKLLLQNNVQIYIVTASVKWAVEPGARFLGLNDTSVIGIETEVIKELITDTPLLPATYRAGKPHALFLKTNGIQPFLCLGNSMGDYELLKSSSLFSVAIRSGAKKGTPLYVQEELLQQKCKAENWISHSFT